MATTQPTTESKPGLLQINPVDNVAVAVRAIEAGYAEQVGGVNVTAHHHLPLGAKLALKDIAAGEKIIKFGEPIGSASEPIRAGEYVHTHNLRSDYIPTADSQGTSQQ